jgi:hypothetical protein
MIRKSVERFFRKDHAQAKSQSAMMIHPQIVALGDKIHQVATVPR